MSRPRPRSPAGRLSLLAYRFLLRLYPGPFRRAYATQMLAAFEQQRHEPRYTRRPLGPLLFWFDIVTDLTASATRRRLAAGFGKPRFPRKREPFMYTLLQDARYALRGLRHHRGVTAAALLTLAIGIGANVAMFSLVDGILLRPFPFPEPDRLVFVWDSNPGRGWNQFSVSPPNFLDYREQNSTFESLTSYYGSSTTLTGVDEPERLQAARVGPDYFQTFGIRPGHGRAFTPEDNEPGNTGVVVLSARLFQRRFGGDPGVIGTSIVLNGVPVTVVGAFDSANDAPPWADVWVPEEFSSDNLGTRGAHYFAVVGRLRPEATLERAEQDVRRIAANLAEAYPDTNSGWTAVVVPLHEERVGGARSSLVLLTGAVALILLIACANIANLLLARATSRRREVAVRVALGAGRGRLVSQGLVESVLLGLAGGLLGLFVAQAITATLGLLAPDSLPRLAQVGIDLRVLGYTVLVSVVTGLLFGIAPALHAARADAGDTLKEGARGAITGTGIRQALVVGEVALAVVIVICAGLLVRSLWRLQGVDPGFVAAQRVTARIGLPATYGMPEQRERFFTRLLTDLAATPGIDSAAATTRLPMAGDFSISFTVEGRPEPDPDQEPSGEMRIVSPDYFETMGIALRRGRDFAATDRLGTQPVAIVNERLAELYFPGEDPVGQRIRIGYAHARDAVREREIIGVVANARVFGLGGAEVPVYYVSYRQTPEPAMSVVVRSAGDIGAAVATLRRTVGALDADIPLYEVTTLQQHVRNSTGQRRFHALLLGSFAGIALLLASIGIYGVMGYTVAQRTRELGIRMALGADRAALMTSVLTRGLLLAGVGVALGALGALAAGRLLDNLLFGISATDPLTFAVVAVFLLAVALIACYLPARRATRIDPTVALHAE